MKVLPTDGMLRANPDLRMLLSASRNLDAEDIRQLVALAERMNRE